MRSFQLSLLAPFSTRRGALGSVGSAVVLWAAASGCSDSPSPACDPDGDVCGTASTASSDAGSLAALDGSDEGALAIALDASGAADSGVGNEAASPAIDAGAATDADASTDVVVAPACDPSKDPKDAPCGVSDAYGVFVSTSGASAATGTAADPVVTITAGIAQAAATGKSRVFVCGGSYAEAVSIAAAQDGISVFGGFNCLAGWTWSGAPTTVSAPGSSLAALQIESTSQPIAIEDLSFVAPDAVGQDASGAGHSSIAAFIMGSGGVSLARVTLVAGRGADGAAGASGSSAPNYPLAMTSAPAASVNPDVYNPGAGGTSTCADGALSAGGTGGVYDSIAAGVSFPGQAGSANPMPAPVIAPLDGLGGIDQGPGDPGAAGTARAGGIPAASAGTLSAAGWEPSHGAAGLAGGPGQGGGGSAGGATFFSAGGYYSSYLAGEGGGAGGCGGAPGQGGGGGGASVALASLSSSVSLTACTLTTSAAGTGGSGGAGQAGQGGGAGGSGPDEPSGGAGGNGAGGSAGAGGTGGLSAGVAWTQGTAPSIDSATVITTGTAGTPGAGGLGGPFGLGVLPAGNDGERGASGSPGASASILAL